MPNGHTVMAAPADAGADAGADADAEASSTCAKKQLLVEAEALMPSKPIQAATVRAPYTILRIT